MKHGLITKIAKAAGITPSHMAYIARGVKKPSPDVAARLEKATGVPRLAWLYPEEYDNPYITGST